MTKQGLVLAAVVLGVLGSAEIARAGVFNQSHFVTPGLFAIGVEPEVTLSNSATGISASAKYTHGLTDFSNLTAILGTGNGARKFRAGGSLSFDFVPDVEKQPGLGIAGQLVYYRHEESPGQMGGVLELIAIPYIHKAFQSAGGEFEPYFSIPFGTLFYRSTYQWTSTLAVGSMFKNSEHIRYVVELGVAINNSQSYVSGGIVYYH